ncbi:MAG: hypothetical protein RI973_1364 [Bacteroidota bacterium]
MVQGAGISFMPKPGGLPLASVTKIRNRRANFLRNSCQGDPPFLLKNAEERGVFAGKREAFRLYCDYFLPSGSSSTPLAMNFSSSFGWVMASISACDFPASSA